MKMPWQNKTGLAKFATIFAIAGVLAFGLCTVGVAVSDSSDRSPASLFIYLAAASAYVEAVCIVGLLVVGVIAFIRSIRNY